MLPGNRRSALPRVACVAVVAAATALSPSQASFAAVDPNASIMLVHPHEGTAGTVPTAVAESYTTRTGTAASYTDSAALDGTTSIQFAGTASTYFDDTGLATTTGQLVWSAPVQLPSLPPAKTMDKFLAFRSGHNPLATVEITSTGALQVRNGANKIVATSQFAVAAGSWYSIDASYQAGTVTIRLFTGDGTSLVGTLGPAVVTAGTPNALRTGLRSVSGPMLIDQVTVAQTWVTAIPVPPPPPPGPCGSLAGSVDPLNPPIYSHVVVIMEENLSYTTWLKTTQSPFSHLLAAQCASESNYHGATHPSQPNYMAVTSGIASGVGVKTASENIFDQLQNSGGTWRNYSESMATPCQASSSSFYKPGHTPAYWYTDLRAPVNTCALDDVPMSPALDDDIANDTLPTFAWISPNECDGFYHVTACPDASTRRIPDGDAWLQAMVGRLTATPSYQAGQTLILITWDEGDETRGTGVDCTDPANASRSDCQMPTLVVSPYITPGATDTTPQSHYSLGGTIADVLGQPRLGREIGAGSLRTGITF